MATVSIDISDELRAKMQERAADTGHSTIEQYIEWLIREDADSVDFGAPDHLEVQLPEQLEAMLDHAMQTPAREMTAADWAEKKRKLIAKYGPQSKAG